MKKVNLASSYIIYKRLYESKKFKNSIDIITIFVLEIIKNKKNYYFDEVILQKSMIEYFSFEIPLAVLKATLENMVAKNVLLKTGDKYKGTDIKDETSFISDINMINNEVEYLYSDIKAYYIKNGLQKNISDESIAIQLYNVLLEPNDEEYGEEEKVLSSYIIKNSKNERISNILKNIREGYIIYYGISNDITFNEDIQDDLYIYLDQEILFYIMNYDGDYSFKYMKEFVDYIHKIDKNNCIKLRYFEQTKKEIDGYFYVASQIVQGKRILDPSKKPMKKIVQNCGTIEEIEMEKTDFYIDLKEKYGIIQDENSTYYDIENYEDNVEGIDIHFDNIKNENRDEGVKITSNINKIRKGMNNGLFLKSRAFFVTNTKDYLQISKTILDSIKGKRQFCYELRNFISALWLSCDKSFAISEVPTMTSVQFVKKTLQSKIGKQISADFDKVIDDVKNNKLSGEKAAARLKALQNLSERNDDITEDNVDELVLSDINEEIKKYEFLERDNNSLKSTINSLNKMLKEEREDKSDYISVNNKLIDEKNAKIESQERKIEELNKTLERMNEKKLINIIIRIGKCAKTKFLNFVSCIKKHNVMFIIIAVIALYILYNIIPGSSIFSILNNFKEFIRKFIPGL